MSNPEKNPQGLQPGATGEYYPPPPPGNPQQPLSSPVHNSNSGFEEPTHVNRDPNYVPPPPADHSSYPHPPPVASGGLLPEQPQELDTPIPPSATHQTNPDPMQSQHTAGSAIPPPPAHQPNIDHVNAQQTGGSTFPPPPPNPPVPQQHASNLEFPPPPTEEQTGDLKHPLPSEPHPLAADSKAGLAGAVPPAGTAAGTTAGAGPGAAVVAEPAQPHKKTWGQRFSNLGQKAAAKLGSPGFLPQPLDKECEKTAQILKAFCKNGVYADPSASTGLPTSTDPNAAVAEPGRDGTVIDPTRQKPKSRSLVTIPSSVISRAVGLAIFTTLRAGYGVTGAMGSGLLVARLPDGSWSPPSAIQVLSVGGGFQLGIDIYDCVCVINTREALSAFMNTRVSIGGDMAVSAGPYGVGGAVEVGSTMNTKDEEERRRRRKEKEAAAAGPAADAPFAPVPAPLKAGEEVPQGSGAVPPKDSSLKIPERPNAKNQRRVSSSGSKPVFSYVKSRGFYAGVQVDGTVIVERKDANAAFYGAPIRVEQILHGEVPHAQGGSWPAAARVLHDVLRGAEAGDLQRQTSATGSVGAPVDVPVDRSAPAAAGPSTAAAGVGSGSAPAPASATASGAPVYDKAAEARADAEPPAYEEAPPAYVDDGVPRPNVGDQKRG